MYVPSTVYRFVNTFVAYCFDYDVTPRDTVVNTSVLLTILEISRIACVEVMAYSLNTVVNLLRSKCFKKVYSIVKVWLIVSNWFEKVYVWSAQNNQIIDRYLVIYYYPCDNWLSSKSCVKKRIIDYVKARNTATIFGSMTQFVKIRLDSFLDDKTWYRDKYFGTTHNAEFNFAWRQPGEREGKCNMIIYLILCNISVSQNISSSKYCILQYILNIVTNWHIFS